MNDDRDLLLSGFEILDACCGSKMFWYDRNNEHTCYVDCRKADETLCDGRRLEVKPDVLADFRDMPFPDNAFNLVVFDPPHLYRAGANSWLAKKYGVLPPEFEWQEYLKAGFTECYRVLRPFGVLLFKWNSDQIPFAEVIKLAPEKPLLGDRTGKTRWTVFVKGART